MRKAIEKSIYYSDVSNFNTVITFEYSDEKSFKNIIKELPNYIDIVATFGRKDNQCYSIFNKLSYKDLLFDKTTSIYLVNRKDIAICMNRKLDKENGLINGHEEKQRIAILKVDSVLSEYQTSSLKHYICYPIVFILGVSLCYLNKK